MIFMFDAWTNPLPACVNPLVALTGLTREVRLRAAELRIRAIESINPQRLREFAQSDATRSRRAPPHDNTNSPFRLLCDRNRSRYILHSAYFALSVLPLRL